MEKWSAIHNTFKFFNLGRPPKFEIIQNDPALKERIKTLSTLKSYYKRNSIEAPDLSNFDKNTDRLDEYLKKLTGDFQKTHGRAIPMHRAYALASPTFTREECYDVLKALRDKKILYFSVPHGITITSTDFSSNVEQ